MSYLKRTLGIQTNAATRALLGLLSAAFAIVASVCAHASDCHSNCTDECTHSVRHVCAGTLTDPVRSCDTGYLDAACYARCTSEKIASCNGLGNFVGCNLWQPNVNWQEAVFVLRQTHISVDECLAIVGGASTAGTAYSVEEGIRNFTSFIDLASKSTVVGLAVSVAAKHAAQCACKAGGTRPGASPPPPPPAQVQDRRCASVNVRIAAVRSGGLPPLVKQNVLSSLSQEARALNCAP